MPLHPRFSLAMNLLVPIQTSRPGRRHQLQASAAPAILLCKVVPVTAWENGGRAVRIRRARLCLRPLPRRRQGPSPAHHHTRRRLVSRARPLPHRLPTRSTPACRFPHRRSPTRRPAPVDPEEAHGSKAGMLEWARAWEGGAAWQRSSSSPSTSGLQPATLPPSSWGRKQPAADLDLPEIIVESEKRGMTFDKLLTVPENDDWVYTDGQSASCVAYVLMMYKEAGLFDPISSSINVTEFTIKDAYILNFFEANTTRLPAWCNKDDNVKLPFCQIKGKYRMELPGYNTMEPYAHMNERCASLPPDYLRSQGC